MGALHDNASLGMQLSAAHSLDDKCTLLKMRMSVKNIIMNEVHIAHTHNL